MGEKSSIDYFDIVAPVLHKAGEIIMSLYKQDIRVEIKDDNSPVTQADKLSHELLCEVLGKTNIPVRSEEDEGYTSNDIDKYWSIDPLDGTKDFINATGDFSILVALIVNSKPVVGYIYQPTTNELYFAQVGKGAYMQSKSGKVHPLNVDQSTPISSQKMIASRFHMSTFVSNLARDLQVKGFIQKGSCGLKIASLARGDCHIYVNASNKTCEWDVAAGQVLLQEAGGVITDTKGNSLEYDRKDPRNHNGIMASCGTYHDEILLYFKENRD